MRQLQTNLQMERNNNPTRLEVLREVDKRNGLEQQEALQQELGRLEKGQNGEQILLDYLNKYGENQWSVLQNTWLNYYGDFECDLLLLTRTQLYLFEVKNYSASFTFLNNQCLINQQKISHNAISQGQRNTINLERIFQNSSTPFKITRAIIFINADNKVTIHDKVASVQIISRNELRDFIWEISRSERSTNHQTINENKVLKILNEYATTNPYTPDTITEEICKQVQKGICCCHCHNFDISTNKSYFICPCGMHEPREEAIVRTICEYGVINYQKYLTTPELTQFFNGDISRNSILKYLNKHFEKLGTGRSAKYLNKKVPFEKN